MEHQLEVTVSEFITLLNQTLETAYPYITVVGELANFRVSKNRWVYFDLKDESAVLRCFGTVYNLPGPLEDGILLKVGGSPRLHSLYGFSLNVQSIRPSGEGAIKKAANLLEAKLTAEGLFAAERKRVLPYPPRHIGLITSSEAAAYTDFIKVLNGRWSGVAISFVNVQVQGESAGEQIVAAIAQMNALADPPEVLVITRGGGSTEDLQTFSTEQVTRAVAASRIPTLVAIGHERDISLAELAADQRASTPSNAAALLVPDRVHILAELKALHSDLQNRLTDIFIRNRTQLAQMQASLTVYVNQVFKNAQHEFKLRQQLITLLDPQAPLGRGYALVRKGSGVIRDVRQLSSGDIVEVSMRDGTFMADVQMVKAKGYRK